MCGLLQADIEPKGTKPVNDDEDIFGDAGTAYMPELPVPKAANGGGAPAPTAGSYFDKKDEMTDLPALPKAGHLCFQRLLSQSLHPTFQQFPCRC